MPFRDRLVSRALLLSSVVQPIPSARGNEAVETAVTKPGHGGNAQTEEGVADTFCGHQVDVAKLDAFRRQAFEAYDQAQNLASSPAEAHERFKQWLKGKLDRKEVDAREVIQVYAETRMISEGRATASVDEYQAFPEVTEATRDFKLSFERFRSYAALQVNPPSHPDFPNEETDAKHRAAHQAAVDSGAVQVDQKDYLYLFTFRRERVALPPGTYADPARKVEGPTELPSQNLSAFQEDVVRKLNALTQRVNALIDSLDVPPEEKQARREALTGWSHGIASKTISIVNGQADRDWLESQDRALSALLMTEVTLMALPTGLVAKGARGATQGAKATEGFTAAVAAARLADRVRSGVQKAPALLQAGMAFGQLSRMTDALSSEDRACGYAQAALRDGSLAKYGLYSMIGGTVLGLGMKTAAATATLLLGRAPRALAITKAAGNVLLAGALSKPLVEKGLDERAAAEEYAREAARLEAAGDVEGAAAQRRLALESKVRMAGAATGVLTISAGSIIGSMKALQSGTPRPPSGPPPPAQPKPAPKPTAETATPPSPRSKGEQVRKDLQDLRSSGLFSGRNPTPEEQTALAAIRQEIGTGAPIADAIQTHPIWVNLRALNTSGDKSFAETLIALRAIGAYILRTIPNASDDTKSSRLAAAYEYWISNGRPPISRSFLVETLGSP